MKKFAMIAALMISQAFCSGFNGKPVDNGENFWSKTTFSNEQYLELCRDAVDPDILRIIDQNFTEEHLREFFFKNDKQVRDLYEKIFVEEKEKALKFHAEINKKFSDGSKLFVGPFEITKDDISDNGNTERMAKNNAEMAFMRSEFYTTNITVYIMKTLNAEIEDFENSWHYESAMKYIQLMQVTAVPKILEGLLKNHK